MTSHGMGVPGAKQDDEVVGLDTHVIMIPSPVGPVPTPMPMPFVGKLSGALSATVRIDDKPAAVKGSTAQNQPQHIPAGGPFQNPPSNQATVDAGSGTVYFDGQGASDQWNSSQTTVVYVGSLGEIPLLASNAATLGAGKTADRHARRRPRLRRARAAPSAPPSR